MIVASTAVLMNMVNFSHGTGNTALQQVTGTLLKHGIRWQSFYLVMLVCCAALFIYLLLLRILVCLRQAGAAIPKTPCSATSNWFVNDMSEQFAHDAERRALYMTLFFSLMTLGRLFGGYIADKLGYFRSILLDGIIASTLREDWFTEARLFPEHTRHHRAAQTVPVPGSPAADCRVSLR